MRWAIISAAMSALGLTLPVAFHAVGLGSMFLPMFMPLLLNGFLVPAPFAVLTGVATPLLSSLATGMPPIYPPVCVAMAVEGGVLGAVAAVLYRGRRKRMWPALAGAIVAGRLTGLAAAWVLARQFGLPPQWATFAALAAGIPGVLLELVAIPMTLAALRERGGNLFSDERAEQA